MRPEARVALCIALAQAGCGSDGAGGGARFSDEAPVSTDERTPDAGAHDPASEGAEGASDAAGEPDRSENDATLDDPPASDAGGYGALPDGGALDPATLPYARSIVRYTPGPNAGFGQEALPDVVLGPPVGKGVERGSLDVLSLGVGGEIVLGFGARAIVDGAGPDFVVFENAFWPGGDATKVFAELGEVSVSEDGTTWLSFPCASAPNPEARYPGCAGFTPTRDYDPFALVPLDPAVSGGDAFDLATLGLARARFVRVRDLSSTGAGTTAGFDLDAIGIVNAEPDAPDADAGR